MKKDTPFQRQAYSLLADDLFSANFPKHLYIEPTNKCQLSCSICPRKDSKRRVGFMDMNLYRHIVDESLRFGPRDRIMLYKDGEPLLHPKLGLMIELVKKKNAAKSISISTNALELNKKKANELLQTELDEIIISLDGNCKETYESIRVGSDYRQVVENLNAFFSLKESKRSKFPYVILQIVDMRKTKRELVSFQYRWQELADEIKVKKFLTWGGHIDSGLKKKKKKRNPCFSLWTTLAINWDGDVSICSLDFDKQGVLGNIKDISLYDIWRSPHLRKLRLRHLDWDFKDVFPCAKCNDWQSHPEFWSKRNIAKAKEII